MNYNQWKESGFNLSVGGSLYLRGTDITELPDNLSVGRSLDLRGMDITELPDNLSVGGNLYLAGAAITKLPDDLSVGGSLDLRGTDITRSKETNCGSHNRTIYCVKIGCDFYIIAGCFFGTFNEFCEAVNKKYTGDSAGDYIANAESCVSKLKEMLMEQTK